MKAVFFEGRGGAEVIAIRELADPIPSRGEVLVRVHAAGLNRADLLQRRGLYPPPPGVSEDVPGLEFAGEVEALGAGVTRFKPGDRVMAVAGGEAQAELVLAHERMLVRVPDRLSFPEAGATMEAFVTSHDALFSLGGLRPGWSVLVHAVGSGVATAALQLARAAGATVIGTSRTSDKLERARAIGLEHGILLDREAPRFADEVKKVTSGEGVPLILDFVGAAYLAENLAALAQGGKIVNIGTLGGAKAPLDLALLMRKRASVIGTVLRPRPLEEKVAATRSFARDCLPLLGSGRVKPVVDAVLPLDQARAAHERMERNDSFGKLVLAL
ncbi:MAG TPA: NAD(P)H-quinone oxidoreductase [Anaeromyxobacteraceae bacterium]|nr:NAD(P)H-quinone oxidoreductase [Anaeromyxobacteraceae bacterium]